MNKALLDPYDFHALPEYIEYDLQEDGLARCAAFNTRGTVLAVGCNDGRVVLWDFEPRSISKILIGHVLPVTSVCWSCDDNALLTASIDASLIRWDVAKATPYATLHFESYLFNASMHPESPWHGLVTAWNEDPYLINWEHPTCRALPYDARFDEGGEDDHAEATPSHDPKNTRVHAITRFGPPNLIFMGDSRGVLTVVDQPSLEIRASVRVVAAGTIKAIEFSSHFDRCLLNCSDCTIRVYDAKTLTPLFQLTELVNQTQWRVARFAPDDEHIVSGRASKRDKLTFWTNPVKGGATAVRFLQLPKDGGLLDLVVRLSQLRCDPSTDATPQWHPHRLKLVSISTSGRVHVWGAYTPERWGAFYPAFTDLKDNEEYIEREDEFDADFREALDYSQTVADQGADRIDLASSSGSRF